MSSSLAFYDIAQLLESADDSDARVARVLERLHAIIPYDRCALLEVRSGQVPRLVAARGTSPTEQAALMTTALALFHQLAPETGGTVATCADARPHLAVPLIGLDQTLGVLFVDRATQEYEEADVRALSVVAAMLAGHASMLHAFNVEAGRVQELARAKRAAEAADRAKNEFLALVSHELRSPLSSILIWVDVLRSGNTADAERARAVATIERAVRTQTKLVDDLLDLSCVAASTLQLELRPIDPAQVVLEALSPLRLDAEQKRLQLEVALDRTLPLLIADPRRLRQVVASLVSNAIKFTPAAGRVEVRLDRAGMHVRLRVSDNGQGIRGRLLLTLFQHFGLVDSSTTRAQGGLGVGLALVKHLVALHGGRVRAESDGEGQGSSFTVELPLAGPAPSLGMPAAATDDKGGSALGGIRVLLVDDDPDIGEVLKFVLESQGALVRVALSAAEALEAVARSAPDVLLSDLAMPGGSGYELMRSIVARRGATAPPAAALSAYAQGQDLREALAAGFRILLEKPIDPSALVAAVLSLSREAGSNTSSALRVEKAFVD